MANDKTKAVKAINFVATNDEQKWEVIRSNIAPNLNAREFAYFASAAKSMGFEPEHILRKEIIPLKVGGTIQHVVTINALRRLAHQTGKYMGCKTVASYDNDNKIVSARCTVKKLMHGQVCEYESEVMLSEYKGVGPLWKTKPVTMLKKVAEVHALRMAFSEAENLYISEEFDHSNMGAKYDAERTVQLTEKIRNLPDPKPVDLVDLADNDGDVSDDDDITDKIETA